MTDNTKTTTKRRSVSKARLYKELEATIQHHKLGQDDTIATLMNDIKEDIVREALK